MTKTAAHIAPLPAALVPTKTSTQLIREHVDRLTDAGVPQKTIALALDFGPNFVSMLKGGATLPLPRVKAFAAAARLSRAERFELITTRLIELHGGKGEFCFETLLTWAEELFSPAVADEEILLDMWRGAVEPAPTVAFLRDPAVATRIQAVLTGIVQQELLAMAEDAKAP